MGSFTCGRCQDVVKKPKVLSHAAFCHCDQFTCVDCMNVFTTNTVKDHTTCVTETEKYQGKWKQRRQETQQQKLQSKADNAYKNGDENNNNNTVKIVNNNGYSKDINNKQANKRSRSALLNDFLNNDYDDDDDSWITQKKTSKKEDSSTDVKVLTKETKSKRTIKHQEEEEEESTKTISTHELSKSSTKDIKTICKEQSQQTKGKKDKYMTNTKMESLQENDSNSAIKHKESRSNVMQSINGNVLDQEICLQTISIGSVKQIKEQLEQVYNENGVTEMTGKEIAAHLSEMFKLSIIHAIKQSLPILKENGVINCITSKSSSNGCDDADCNKVLKKHKTWRLANNS